MAIGVIAPASVGVALYFVVNFAQGLDFANQGYKALALGDYNAAIARFASALKKPLGNFQRSLVHLNRGFAFNSEAHFDEAIRDYTEALRLNPKLDSAYEGRGWAYQQKDEIEKAIVDLSEAIRRNPNSQSAYYNRGSIFYAKREVDRALADFDESVRCNPDRADGFIMRGICYLSKNDFDRALANFDAAILIEPANARAFAERAKLYERKGEPGKSMHDLAAAEQLASPGQSSTTPQRRDSPFLKKEPGFQPYLDVKPLPHLDEKGQLVVKTYSELIKEGSAASEAGEFDRAIELFNAALAMNITSEQASIAVMNRGNNYRGKHDLEKALRDYEQAITLDPRNAGAYVNRAAALSQKGEREDAIKDEDQAIRLNPNQWEAYFNRATDLWAEGRLDEAIADLERVMKLNPGFVASYTGRAALYRRKGENDKAISDYNKAIEIDPNSAEAYVGRANARIQKKQYTEATNDLERAAQLNPKRLDVVLNSVAWLRATCPEKRIRNGRKAIKEATKACELTEWKIWGYIDTLAAAHAEAGNFDEAIKYQKQILPMAQEEPKLAEEAKQRLTLYEHRKPYREEPKP